MEETNNTQQNTFKEIETLKTYLQDYINLQGYKLNRQKKFICRNPEHQEQHPSMSLNPRSQNKQVHCFSCGASYSIIDLFILDHEIGNLNAPTKERLHDKENIKEACNGIKTLFGLDELKTDYKQPLPEAKNYKKLLQEDLSENVARKKEIFNLACASFKNAVFGNPTREYFLSRGIKNDNLLSMLNLRNIYKNIDGKEERGKGYIFIPYELIGEAKTLTRRTISYFDKEISKQERYKHFGINSLYDPFKYLTATTQGKDKLLFICEGEIDAISYYEAISELNYNKQALNVGSVGLGSTANANIFYRAIEQLATTPEAKENIYFVVALDNDSAGQKTNIEIINELEANGFKYTSLVYPTGSKDANDYLKNDRNGFKACLSDFIVNYKEICKKAKKEHIEAVKKEIEEAKQNYIQSKSALNNLPRFLQEQRTPSKTIKTRFRNLDDILQGGFHEGLTVLGANSSLGKTSFILQVADQIAQSRAIDVFYYSLEMSINELIAKSLSRLMFLNSGVNRDIVKSQAQILQPIAWNNQEKELFNKALEDYKTFANNLFFKENTFQGLTVDNIKSDIEEHINKTGKAPIVFIDYLQILKSPEAKRTLTDKQIIEENIKALCFIAHEYKISIIAISSLNRASYGENVKMESFKESGLIEYSSETAIGLNYYLTDTQRSFYNEEIREIKKDAINDNDKERQAQELYKSLISGTPRNISLEILKNRKGSNNKYLYFLFYPQYNYFEEAEKDSNNDLKAEMQSLEYKKDLLEHSREQAKQGTEEEFIELPF